MTGSRSDRSLERTDPASGPLLVPGTVPLSDEIAGGLDERHRPVVVGAEVSQAASVIGPDRPACERVVLMTMRYPANHPGGVERVVAMLTAELKQGHSGWRPVTAFAYRGRAGAARVPLLGDLVAAATLMVKSGRRADVVIVHGAEYAWGPVLLAKLRRRPSVVVWHGVRGAESLPLVRGPLDHGLQKLFLRCSRGLQRAGLWADAVVAVSPSVASEIREHFGYTGRVEVIPNGVAPSVAQAVGDQLGTAAGPLRVIWVGTSPHRKGLDIALAACRTARAAGLDLALTVVGVPKSAANLSGGSDPSWIIWAGSVGPQEVDRLMAEQDLMLSPTRYEACSMAIFEALAAGLPVVGSRTVRWQIGGAGETVASEDPSDYAEAILRMTNSEHRRQLGRLARDRAGEFSWGAAVTSYVRLLDAAVDPNRGAPGDLGSRLPGEGASGAPRC